MIETSKKLIGLLILIYSITAFSQQKDGYFIILDGKKVFIENTVKENRTIALPNEDSNQSVKSIGIHIVKKGENLYSISRLYGITVEELSKLNNFSKGYNTSVGDRLKISGFSKTVTKGNNASYHIVVKGNTLYSLAKKYGITIEKLKKLNNIYDNTILIGQRLKLN
ncbi:MAG: LysM peptidoglycan-binding domain-containing protein [Flavobacteriaceae bacterium]